MDYDDGNAGNGEHQSNIEDADINLSSWNGLGTSLQFNTNLNSGVGSNRNMILGANRLAAHGTLGSYTISVGDEIEASYMWRAASNWDPADRITFSLYYTDTDAIDGARTNLFTYEPPTENTSTYRVETVPNHIVTDAGAAGKSLYVLFGDNASAGGGEFARVDNVFIQVNTVIPEPSTMSLIAVALGAIAVLRRR